MNRSRLPLINLVVVAHQHHASEHKKTQTSILKQKRANNNVPYEWLLKANLNMSGFDTKSTETILESAAHKSAANLLSALDHQPVIFPRFNVLAAVLQNKRLPPEILVFHGCSRLQNIRAKP
jgi:hypothetical protein